MPHNMQQRDAIKEPFYGARFAPQAFLSFSFGRQLPVRLTLDAQISTLHFENGRPFPMFIIYFLVKYAILFIYPLSSFL